MKFTMVAQKSQKAQKQDQAKPSIHLIPMHALDHIAYAMQHGAEKYGKNNYLLDGGLEHHRLIDAAFRHLIQHTRGENIDPESGLLHLAHAGASILMLLETIATYGYTKDTRVRSGEDV